VDHELTTTQAREIVHLHRRHPGAQVTVHRKPWGLIAEARRNGRTVELERFDWGGTVRSDRRLDLAGSDS
jgi:hypothetical protein